MSFLLKSLSAALLLALGIGSARADSFVDALSTNTTIPLPTQSCFYVDQFNGTSYNDTKLCSGWATAIGALSTTNNLSDLTNPGTARANLGLGTAATGSTGTSGATIPLLSGANTWSGVQSLNSGDFVLNGATSGSTTVTAAAAASGTLTLPAATDTLTANTTAATLTNKTINCANNTCTVRLANDVTGNLPVTNLNGGASASASTFWRGDGTWATPAASGYVKGPGSSTNAYVPQWNGTGGTSLSAGLPVGVTGASTIVETNSTGLISNALISGLPNADLANSTVTINSHSLPLGGSLSLAYSDFGNLPVANLNGGVSASASTFWRGDGTWATPAVSGNVTGPSSAVSGDIATFSGTSGTVLQDSGRQLSALAALASPSFTGTPMAPTAPTATNTAQIATTAYVQNQAYATLASPALSGTPSAPTPAQGTNSTQIATTAYVQNQAYATLASPALSGTPTAPTPAQGTNSTQIATTAFVKSQQMPISIGWIAGQNPNNAVASVINQAMTVNAIVGAVEVANGSAATVTVNHAPSGVACSAGTALHSGSFNANGAAATDQTLPMTTASLAVGDRICLQTTGGTNWNSGSAVGTITIFASPS